MFPRIGLKSIHCLSTCHPIMSRLVVHRPIHTQPLVTTSQNCRVKLDYLQVCDMYESAWYQFFRLSIPASAQDAKAALFAPSQFKPRLLQLSQARYKINWKRDRKQNSAVTQIAECGHCFSRSPWGKKHTVLNHKSRAASGPTARCPKMASTEFRMYQPLLSKCRCSSNNS